MNEDQAMIAAKIDALTARAEAAEELVQQLQRNNDSLWLEKEATNHARRNDNAYLIKRAEAAEARVARLRGALTDARETVVEWAAYADEYFRKKYDFAGDLERLDAAIAETELPE